MRQIIQYHDYILAKSRILGQVNTMNDQPKYTNSLNKIKFVGKFTKMETIGQTGVVAYMCIF